MGDRSVATSKCNCWFSCADLRALRFQLLDLVAELNALEVLPGVKEQACRERRSTRAHAANSSRTRDGEAVRAKRQLSMRFTV